MAEPIKIQGQSGARIAYLDKLRVISLIAVVILHTVAPGWETANIYSYQWKAVNVVNSCVRWCVPVFVMISGSLFLGKEISIKKLYSKYILRMLMAFIGWSAIYTLFTSGDRIKAFFTGYYHMWYILMTIGLYMCVPVVRVITQNEKITKYYLLLAFVFVFLLPEVKILLVDFASDSFNTVVDLLANSIDRLGMQFLFGYVSYFMLGYMLSQAELKRQTRSIIYALGVAGFAYTIGMSFFVAYRYQTYCNQFFGNFTVNVLVQAIAIYVWMKYRNEDARETKALASLAKWSFGAYILHAPIIEQLNKRIGLNVLSFNPILSSIVIAVIVLVVSYLFSAILNQIPVIKRYLV